MQGYHNSARLRTPCTKYHNMVISVWVTKPSRHMLVLVAICVHWYMFHLYTITMPMVQRMTLIFVLTYYQTCMHKHRCAYIIGWDARTWNGSQPLVVVIEFAMYICNWEDNIACINKYLAINEHWPAYKHSPRLVAMTIVVIWEHVIMLYIVSIFCNLLYVYVQMSCRQWIVWEKSFILYRILQLGCKL